jgi:6,7-dimethyl-8-ribityllumazine synthase
MNEISGDFVNIQGRFALVAGRFNQFITEKLIQGAVDFEIPMVSKKLAYSNSYAAIITLGAVIRGATPHFEHVAGECARGVASLNLESDVPVIFGVLTTDTIEQAIERAGTKAGNKGSDAALAALEMVSLLAKL